MAIIKVKRGTKASIPILEEGEIGFSTDTNETYIGDGSNNYKFLSENDIVTSISDLGSDAVIPSEQAVREAINLDVNWLSGEISENSFNILNNISNINDLNSDIL